VDAPASCDQPRRGSIRLIPSCLTIHLIELSRLPAGQMERDRGWGAASPAAARSGGRRLELSATPP